MTDARTEIVLIDLSSIAHPIWHMSQAEPDANAASRKIVERVRTLSSQHPHAAICCDAGQSFRKDIAASYKANRPEHEAPLHHQIDLAKEQLEADGYPVWGVRGFEADDLIASATMRAEAANFDVLIISADKDLLQLVGPHVRAMSAKSGDIIDEAAVVTKFGVKPDQVRDYLSLVGDASDNIKGAKGIGPKKAADLLTKFGTLDQLYAALETAQGRAIGLPASVETSLKEFRKDLETSRALIALRTDVEVPFAEITNPRSPKENTALNFEVEDDGVMDQPKPEQPTGPVAVEPASQESPAASPTAPSTEPNNNNTSIAVRDADVILPAPKEWERGLDPRSMKDARVLAKDMHDSRMFSAYGTPQAVLSTIMVGRELGLPAMASLRSVHIIEGKHALAAALMAALVLRSGLAEYFEPVEFDASRATFETKRKGARNPVKLTHTIEDAQRAWSKGQDAWNKSGWGRNPIDMLVARAQARLCRMVYPDLLAGLYTPEELAEIRESLAAA